MIRALALLLAMTAPAAAQSTFGCEGVETDQHFAAVEGAGGTFFRLEPDLRMWHAVEDQTVARLARLSETLAANGTTLVYVPLPLRSLAMPDRLPLGISDYGFDPVMAATVHDLAEDRLRAAGVIVPRIRTALRLGSAEAPAYQPTDPRLTVEGARRLSTAVAEALAPVGALATLPRAQFATVAALEVVPLPSPMRAALQRHCLTDLPQVALPGRVTQRLQGGATSTSLVGSAAAPRIAILGTEVIGDPALNLAGELAEATGFDTQIYAVDGGGAFAAISAYMTSRAFQDSRPAVIVWVNPVQHSLAATGDQPLAELTAAAGPGCTVVLPVLAGAAPGSAVADLAPIGGGGDWTLYLDADGTPATEARFDLTGTDGLTRSFYVTRHKDQLATGRFYLPLTALAGQPLARVEVHLDAAFAGPVRMAACNG